MRRRFAVGFCLCGLLGFLVPRSVLAVETIIAGTVGAPSGGQWPIFIAIEKGFLTEAGVALDIIYVPSAPSVIQQLVAGSLDIVISSGVVEPIMAADKSAPVSLIRIIGQVPPYALLAKPGIKTIKELKGKTISIGGLTDVTRVYFDRMMAGNGMKDGDYDLVVAGATGARFAALQSGAVDAAILIPPLSFQAESAGFVNVGLAMDYVTDLPFTGTMVFNPWALQHKQAVAGLVTALDRGVAWFNDPANREEAIALMMKAAQLDRREIETSYDFFRKIDFFERTGKVSRGQIQKMIDVQRAMGTVTGPLTADQVVLAGVTELSE